MVEVVQDLFDHVTYAGGVGRRRVDSVRGFSAGTPRPGANDYGIVKEDPLDPRGPQIRCMKDLMFHEMLDKPFEQKGYRAQLEEFAYRGERIIRQIDHKFGELHRMIEDDVLRRSDELLRLMRSTNDELYRAHGLICGELEDIWHMHFEPFFYPSEDSPADEGMQPPPSASEDEAAVAEQTPQLSGGWLDLGDVILTSRLLIRYVAELVALVSMAVQQLPEEVLAQRAQLRATPPHPALRAIVAAFAARVPWIGADLKDDADCPQGGEHHPPLAQSAETSPLNEAISALDGVLQVHLKELCSDLHRTMYLTFMKMCSAYARWKRTFKVERKRAAAKEAASTEMKYHAQRRATAVIAAFSGAGASSTGGARGSNWDNRRSTAESGRGGLLAKLNRSGTGKVVAMAAEGPGSDDEGGGAGPSGSGSGILPVSPSAARSLRLPKASGPVPLDEMD